MAAVESHGPGRSHDGSRSVTSATQSLRTSWKRLDEALRTAPDRPGMLLALLEAGAGLLGTPSSVLWALVADTGRMAALHRVGDAPRPPEGHISAGNGLAGTALSTLAPAVWPGPVAPIGVESAVEGRAVAVPVRCGGHPIGVAAFYGRAGQCPVTDDDIDSLSILVRQTEIAIDCSFVRDEAVRLSLLDGLTGLWNRRHFDLQLDTELTRAARFGDPFSLLFCDVDGFKVINDTFGHQAGDTVLVELGRRLSEATREVDVVTRFGGDEFTLLLPRTDIAGALALADKISGAVSREPVALADGSTVAATISIGAATYPDHARKAAELVRTADAALYQAKADGGNRVERAKVAAL